MLLLDSRPDHLWLVALLLFFLALLYTIQGVEWGVFIHLPLGALRGQVEFSTLKSCHCHSWKRRSPSWQELLPQPEALPPRLAGKTCSARLPLHRFVLASCPWRAGWITKTLFPFLPGSAAADSSTALGGSWCCSFNLDSAPLPAPPVADQILPCSPSRAVYHGAYIGAWCGCSGPRLASQGALRSEPGRGSTELRDCCGCGSGFAAANTKNPTVRRFFMCNLGGALLNTDNEVAWALYVQPRWGTVEH